jgi:hypothetical protein
MSTVLRREGAVQVERTITLDCDARGCTQLSVPLNTIDVTTSGHTDVVCVMCGGPMVAINLCGTPHPDATWARTGRTCRMRAGHERHGLPHGDAWGAW